MKIFLIYGGKSAEHDISILTAYSIIKEVYYDYYEVEPVYITRDGEWIKGAVVNQTETIQFSEALRLTSSEETFFSIEEGIPSKGKIIKPSELKEEEAVIFPVLHGPNGEDGTVQGLFEVIGMPYVGAGVLASACGMDKIISKQLFQQAGLPQVPYVPIHKGDWLTNADEVFKKCEGTLVYPMYVKPANLGSSVGISKAETRTELEIAINLALQYDRRVVVEQGIEAREIEVAILGNDDIHTSVPGELIKESAFYDFDAKYINNKVTLQIPARVSEEVEKQLRSYSIRAFQAIDGSGLSRCDFFVTGNDEIFINELNTMPGFTQFSMYPLLWRHTGLNYGDLVEELIQLALKRFKESLKFEQTDRV
ncbi:D-alanine--D-alanine ligase [Carnobacterium funditum]|uniref:D-alanine--D-alanine ligase n=1 Tax=Carnobacterium funditum TaxID=2752 RepID=UPI000555E12F|nr:D-alanine--D-alanine ligase [Carnobacterium funditum]